MRLKINQTLLDFFSARRVYSAPDRKQRWRVGEILLANDECQIEPYTHINEGHVIPHRLGAFSYSAAPLGVMLSVGRYCSIGPGLRVMGSRHPTDWVTTSPATYFGGALDAVPDYYADNGLRPPPLPEFDPGLTGVSIGHDVWVGAEVMIKRSVTIGHGAVIAARAVVTRDVPPYAVVAGVPARLLRYRFSEEVVQRLLASEWWNYGPDLISRLDVREPDRLADRLADAIARGAARLAVAPVTARDMINAVEPGAI